MERTTRNLPTVLLAAALAVSVALTLVLALEMTFFQDTWAFLIERRDPTVFNLLHPHNEHLVVFPVLLTQLFLRVFGMTSAMPEYVLLTIFLAGTALLFYVYVRRRVGPWLALFATVLILCLGPAWEVLLWPFEITFIGPILFGLAMLLALEREDRRGDVAACAFLILALGFSGLGVAFIAGAVAAVLQGPRRSWLGRAYVFVIPVVLYIAWYLGWGHVAETHMSIYNVLASPRFVADAIAAALGSAFGLATNPTGIGANPDWGRAMLIALVVVLGYRQLRKPGFFPGLWPVTAVAAANWFLTAFNAFPGREPTSGRYQYAGAIFVLMILANLLKDVRPSKHVLWAAAVVTALAVGPNLVVLKTGAGELKEQAVLTRSEGAAIEIAQRTVDPNFELTPDVAGTASLVNIYAGKYLQAVDEYGSPAYSLAELVAAPEKGRRQADVVLAKALPLSTVTHTDAYDPGSGGENCVEVEAGGAAPPEVPISPGLTRIELAPGPRAEFSLRRFAVGEYPVTTEGAPGNSVTVLRVPRDAATQPWYLHVDARQAARVCR